MFGHQNDTITQDQQSPADVTLPDAAIDDLAAPPSDSLAADAQPADNQATSHEDNQPEAPTPIPPNHDAEPAAASPSSTDNFLNQPTAVPPVITPSTPSPAPAPAVTLPEPEAVTVPDMPAPSFDVPDLPETPTETEPQADSSSQPVVQAADSNLLSIKQEALESLSPLVDKLDQAPEEKFNTLMMLIRASDNHALIGDAHEAAKKIEDEKTRAQALLDVVNEINYFTHGKADKEA